MRVNVFKLVICGGVVFIPKLVICFDQRCWIFFEYEVRVFLVCLLNGFIDVTVKTMNCSFQVCVFGGCGVYFLFVGSVVNIFG